MSKRRNIFPFFSLSRELRDIIYSNLPHAEQPIETKAEVHAYISVYIQHAPLSSMFLVSKKWKQEYEEQIEKQTMLLFVDRVESEPIPFEIPRLPQYASYIRRAELRFRIDCNKSPGYGQPCGSHSSAVKHCLRLFQAGRMLAADCQLKLKLGVLVSDQNTGEDLQWPHTLHDHKLWAYVDEFTCVRGVKEVEIYRVYYEGQLDEARPEWFSDLALRDFAGQKMFAAWSSRGGWVIRRQARDEGR